eukprot:UN23444
MAIFLVQAVKCHDWLPEADDALKDVLETIYQIHKKCHRVHFVLNLTKECYEKVRSTHSLLVENTNDIKLKLLNIKQAKELIRKRCRALCTSGPDKMSLAIVNCGIFNSKFKLPCSPRIIRRLAYLASVEKVSTTFLIRLLQYPPNGSVQK